MVVVKHRERERERVAFEQQRKYNSPRRTNLPTILVLVTTISRATTSSLVFSSTQPLLLSLSLTAYLTRAGKKDTDISIGIHHSLLAQRSSSLSLSLTPSPFPAVLRLILSRLLSTSLSYPLIHPPNPCFCICSPLSPPLSRPLSPLRYPPPHGISRLLSFLVRTLPREATTVSSFHLSPFQSFFSTTFWRYVEPH